MGDFEALFAVLDPDPRRRGREFEVVCKWFLANDPTYAPRLRRVWLWREWAGRWSDVDAGIDLVAEDVDGKLWAVQAKAWAADRPIPKKELNKFLSESNRAVFACRLLITTSAVGLHPIAANVVAAQEKPVLIIDRHALRASPVDWPERLEDLRTSPGDVETGKSRIPEIHNLPPTPPAELIETLRVRDPGDPRWAQWLGLLERYVAEFGHARVAANYSVDGRALGRWVIHQRQRWAQGKLSPGRVERLQRLPGWTFSVHEAAFLDNYHQLAKFVATQGSPSVPVDFVAETGLCLAAWIVNQRTRHAAGRLAPHRVRLLEALPGWSWDRAETSRIRLSPPAEP